MHHGGRRLRSLLNNNHDLVYRELAKTDKSKKGSANINVSSVSNKVKPATVVTSAKSKGKGKEKAVVGNMPPPLTTVPLGASVAASASSSGAVHSISSGGIDADEEMADPDHEAEGVEGVDEEEGEDVMDEDDEGEEDAVLEDPMVMEEEELRRDARGLEEPPSALDAHAE